MTAIEWSMARICASSVDTVPFSIRRCWRAACLASGAIIGTSPQGVRMLNDSLKLLLASFDSAMTTPESAVANASCSF